MKTVGNILWFLLAGIWTALGWLIVALVLTILIVTIPMARQCLKLAHFSLWPMGRVAVPSSTVPVRRALHNPRSTTIAANAPSANNVV